MTVVDKERPYARHYCHLCGKQIDGKGRAKSARGRRASRLFHHPTWPKDQALRVCADCWNEKPRCSVCGMPMATQTPHGVCVTCAASLSFCLSCGKAVTGQYVLVDGIGPYCQDCYVTRPACDVCSAPLTDERWQLSDGRLSCAYCHATAVYTPRVASDLYEEMKRVIHQNLGMVLNVPTGLALVDRNQLLEIIDGIENRKKQDGNGGEPLDPQRTLGIYARKGMRRGIYIQTGLPRNLLLQISAHEFAHAWQGENCPLLRDPIVHEGLAEWVAYRVMGYYRLFRQQSRMQSRALSSQDIYGQGLRWALEVEAKYGTAAVIDACRISTVEAGIDRPNTVV